MLHDDLFTLQVHWVPNASPAAPRRGGLDIYHLDVIQYAQRGGYFPDVVGGVRLAKKTTAPPPPPPVP